MTQGDKGYKVQLQPGLMNFSWQPQKALRAHCLPQHSTAQHGYTSLRANSCTTSTTKQIDSHSTACLHIIRRGQPVLLLLLLQLWPNCTTSLPPLRQTASTLHLSPASSRVQPPRGHLCIAPADRHSQQRQQHNCSASSLNLTLAKVPACSTGHHHLSQRL